VIGRPRGEQRALAAVPRWILCVLAGALAAQIGWQAARRAGAPSASDLPPAPSAAALRLASLGETAALARLAMIWLQAFDSRSDNATPYQKLDYGRLISWLGAILATDPRSAYPLFAAARVYAENADQRKRAQCWRSSRQSSCATRMHAGRRSRTPRCSPSTDCTICRWRGATLRPCSG
jgi:hypothetical protein